MRLKMKRVEKKIKRTAWTYWFDHNWKWSRFYFAQLISYKRKIQMRRILLCIIYIRFYKIACIQFLVLRLEEDLLWGSVFLYAGKKLRSSFSKWPKCRKSVLTGRRKKRIFPVTQKNSRIREAFTNCLYE